ncbi:MAG: Bro-N domain-containing protein [Prevotella sp.]|nr:Bro-N domain-containing protein [Prevotella sp.]
MYNKISTFKNKMFGQIRTMTDERGDPWFVGKDVAEALGYTDPQKAMKMHVDDEDKLTRQIVVSGQKPLNAIATHVDEDDSQKQGLIDCVGRTQKAIFINESGLYSLTIRYERQNIAKSERKMA